MKIKDHMRAFLVELAGPLACDVSNLEASMQRPGVWYGWIWCTEDKSSVHPAAGMELILAIRPEICGLLRMYMRCILFFFYTV